MTKFRIAEFKNGLGESVYRVEQRVFFIWMTCRKWGTHPLMIFENIQEYPSLKYAEGDIQMRINRIETAKRKRVENKRTRV